jgi:hypothetical protein
VAHLVLGCRGLRVPKVPAAQNGVGVVADLVLGCRGLRVPKVPAAQDGVGVAVDRVGEDDRLDRQVAAGQQRSRQITMGRKILTT